MTHLYAAQTPENTRIVATPVSGSTTTQTISTFPSTRDTNSSTPERPNYSAYYDYPGSAPIARNLMADFNDQAPATHRFPGQRN